MEPIELSALTGAGSAFVAALSYWAKTNHERRRVTRTVLYYLLELHHVAYRVRAAVLVLESELVRELNVSCQARGLRFNEAEAAAAFKQARPLLADFGRKQLEGTVSDSADAFSKALSDLARENPVLAFRLRGRDQVALLRQKIEGFAKQHSVAESKSADPDDSDWSQLDDLLFTMAVEELRKAIRTTAWGCDVVTHFRTELLLRSAAREQASGELSELVRRIAGNYVASVVGPPNSSR